MILSLCVSQMDVESIYSEPSEFCVRPHRKGRGVPLPTAPSWAVYPHGFILG